MTPPHMGGGGHKEYDASSVTTDGVFVRKTKSSSLPNNGGFFVGFSASAPLSSVNKIPY